METETVPRYAGLLASLQPGLKDFLLAEGLPPDGVAADGTILVDSLLATAEQNMGLDWKQRAQLQARLKVASKRLLIQFGTDPVRADEVAERLVTWMRIEAPEETDTRKSAVAAGDRSAP